MPREEPEGIEGFVQKGVFELKVRIPAENDSVDGHVAACELLLLFVDLINRHGLLSTGAKAISQKLRASAQEVLLKKNAKERQKVLLT